MSTKSHTHKTCGTLREEIFPIMRYVEIHQQRSFFDNRKDIPEIIVLKIQTVSTFFGAFAIYRILKIKIKIKISIFGGISKFLKLIVFGQILTRFGSFG
jgi:hypothetical protein